MAKHIPETVMSYIAGIVYAVGFYIWVDGTVDGHENYGKWKSYDQGIRYNVCVHWYDWIPLIVGTIALFLINVPPHSYLFEDEDSGLGLVDESTKKKVYLWMFISFIIAFAAVCLGIWRSVKLMRHSDGKYWPGISLIISCVLIFASSIIYRFQRAFEEQDDAI